MNMRTSAAARQILRQRRAVNGARHALDRRPEATLAVYATAAKVTGKAAASLASGLRTVAKRLGITGTAGNAFRKGLRRACTRFGRAAVRAIAAAYKPRKPEFKAARAYLMSI